jgi:putative membrane protein
LNWPDWVWIPEQAPTLWRLIAPEFQPVPILPVIGLVMAALYLAGAIRMWATRRRWSVVRTLFFLLGCALIVLTMGLAVEGYGYVMFSVFMFQQLTLMIAVPPLLILGSPGTLLLRATPHRGLGHLVHRLAFAGLRSRLSRWLLHPALGIPIFLLSFYGLYLGGLADYFLMSAVGHIALEVLFLVAGMIFTIPILSSDPLPIRLGHGGRVLDILLEMALHAFFGVIVMMTPGILVDAFANPPADWNLDPVADQQIAGGLAWSYGEGPTALILIYLLHSWYRADTRQARAADRKADEQGDPDLAAYNEYLARLRGGRDDHPTSNTLEGEPK